LAELSISTMDSNLWLSACFLKIENTAGTSVEDIITDKSIEMPLSKPTIKCNHVKVKTAVNATPQVAKPIAGKATILKFSFFVQNPP
jgi:hypothetical protein